MSAREDPGGGLRSVSNSNNSLKAFSDAPEIRFAESMCLRNCIWIVVSLMANHFSHGDNEEKGNLNSVVVFGLTGDSIHITVIFRTLGG